MALRGISIMRVGADRARRGRAAAAGDQAHLAEEVARGQLGDLHLLRSLLRPLPQLHAAGGDDQEVVRVVVLADDHLAVAVLADARGEERVAQLLLVRGGEQRDARAQRGDALAHGPFPERQALLQHRLVGRLDLASHQVLDDLPALVHPELDQIAPAGRADEEEAGHARLVHLAEDRPRVLAVAACSVMPIDSKNLRGASAPSLRKISSAGDARHVAAHVEVGVAVVDLLHASR